MDQPYLGIQWYDTVGDGSAYEHCKLLRSVVLTFGGRCSPYLACQGQNRILHLIKGRPDDPQSSFAFDRVILNLPCSKGYDASLPRVMEINKDGELATGEATYMDDAESELGDLRLGIRPAPRSTVGQVALGIRVI